MLWSGRFPRLLVVVAVVLLACTPHRGGETSARPTAVAEPVPHIAQIALSPIGLGPVVLKRHGVASLNSDDARRLLPSLAALAVAVLVAVRSGRRWTAAVLAVAGLTAALAGTHWRLRAPPLGV